MDAVQQLQQRREAIVQQMLQIRSMTRGAVSEQFQAVRHKSGPSVRRGPYYVLCRSHKGKTVSQRVPGGQVAQARADVAAYKQFVELCRQFEQLTEQLGQLERRGGADPGKKRRS
jgi:hypothetical protein